MAVTIVATAGAANANSFVTEAEAIAYMAARLNVSGWTTLEGAVCDNEDEPVALVEATREVSALTFDGYRATTTQALSWPRTGVTDPDGIGDGAEYADTVVPQRVKDATCELALQFLKAGTTDLASLNETGGIVRKKVGPIETEWAPGSRATGLARYPRVHRLLAPLLGGLSSGQVRLVR